jgi:hypothetical protein
VDLIEMRRVRKRKDLKSLSNKRQAEKRRREKEEDKERLKSLSPQEKEKLVRGVIEAEKCWVLLSVYDRDTDNNINWSDGKKKKRDWEEGNPEEDFWELNKLPVILEKMEKDKKAERERAELARIERNKSR